MFRATGSVQKFDGFLKVYQEGRDEKPHDGEDDDEERNLPLVEKGETLKLNSIDARTAFYRAAAALLRSDAGKGAGRKRHRPAVDLRGDHDDDPGPRVRRKDRRPFSSDAARQDRQRSVDRKLRRSLQRRPTRRGWKRSSTRSRTANSIGATRLREFYDKFANDLENAAESIKNKKKTAIPTDEICEKCGAGMVIKFGRFGQFLACANYPECKNTREVASNKSRQPSGGVEGDERRTRPKKIPGLRALRQARWRLKKGRFGSFYGCTGYPECKNIRKIAKGDQKPVAPPVRLDENCPKDGAQLVQTAGPLRRIHLLLELSEMRLRQARDARDHMPEGRRRDRRQEITPRQGLLRLCELSEMRCRILGQAGRQNRARKCSAPFLLEKTTKKDGTVRYCQNEDCDYKMAVDNANVTSDAETARFRPADSRLE